MTKKRASERRKNNAQRILSLLYKHTWNIALCVHKWIFRFVFLCALFYFRYFRYCYSFVIWTRINTLQFCLKDETNELTEIYFLFFCFFFEILMKKIKSKSDNSIYASWLARWGNQCSFSYWLAMRIRAPASHTHSSLLCAHFWIFLLLLLLLKRRLTSQFSLLIFNDLFSYKISL